MGEGNKRGYKSLEADEYCGFPPGTLKQARHHGVLYGEDPIKFRKIGRVVIYLKEDLDERLNRSPAFKNTAESNLAKQAV